MNTAQLLLAVVSITNTILGPACSQQTVALPLTLSSTVINQGDGLCTSNLVRESVQQDIDSGVQELVQTALSFRSVDDCGEGLWKRVAFLNTSDSTEQCPSVWPTEYNRDNVRACGRPVGGRSCPGKKYSVSNIQYSKVCGRIIGYQKGSPSGFRGVQRDADAEGVTVTHGNPQARIHIWSFAAGSSEKGNDRNGCPCSSTVARQSSAFVGDDYFCESGSRTGTRYSFVPGDPLWDGQGCPRGDCCSFNSPPWFSVELPSPTTDDIEVRICADQSTMDEDTPIGLIEIYIQ